MKFSEAIVAMDRWNPGTSISKYGKEIRWNNTDSSYGLFQR